MAGALLVAVACSSNPGAETVTVGGGGGTFVDGLDANLPDAELTERVPLVLEGAVIAKEDVAMRDDPFLPEDWQSDPSGKRMVDAGARPIKWRVPG